MYKQTDRSIKVSVEEKYAGNSSKFLALAEIAPNSNSESLQQNAKNASAGQTHLFYTKPIHRARKYDLL